MITLIDQLVEELQEEFNSREDSYKNVLVKAEYDILPRGTFPKVTIDEIDNTEIVSRSTRQGERTTRLTYQIKIFTRDTQEESSKKAARTIIGIIDDFLKPPRYQMSRLGAPAIIPDISDHTLMTATLRYSCVYDYETNLIYKN